MSADGLGGWTGTRFQLFPALLIGVLGISTTSQFYREGHREMTLEITEDAVYGLRFRGELFHRVGNAPTQ